MPAALYPKNIRLEILLRTGMRVLVANLNEIKQPLLCARCEQRFSQNGESEVLRHVASKIANKPIPLVALLQPGKVVQEDESLKSYCGTEAGLNMDMFAYFALSIAWRSTFSWPAVGVGHTQPLRLGAYQEPIRKFLAEDSRDFPLDIAVIVIVCIDKDSREVWTLPAQSDETWYHEIRFQTFGVFFRTVLGRNMDPVLRQDSRRAIGKRIHVGDASTKTRQMLSSLGRAPDNDRVCD